MAHKMPNCYIHEETESVAFCKKCNNAYCGKCRDLTSNSGLCLVCARDETNKQLDTASENTRSNGTNIIKFAISAVAFVVTSVYVPNFSLLLYFIAIICAGISISKIFKYLDSKKEVVKLIKRIDKINADIDLAYKAVYARNKEQLLNDLDGSE